MTGLVANVLAATEGRGDEPASRFNGVATSWRDLLDRAGRTAAGLRALGVKEGDRVCILSGNSDLYMLLYLAVPWAGAVTAPLNSRWSVAENRWAIGDCAPSVLFADAASIAANAALFDDLPGVTRVSLDDVPRAGWLPLSDLQRHNPMPDAGRSGDDLLAIFYTGGTTGRPKGVMLSHAGFTSNIRAMRSLGLCPDGCRMLVVAPLFHLAATAALTLAMLAGGTAVIAAAFDPVGTLDLIAAEGITDALLVPTMIQMMVNAPAFDPTRLAGLRSIMYGASPMPEAVLDRIMAAAPHVDFYQCYGMTEVSCTATLLPPAYHVGDHRAAGRHRGAGLPIANTEVRIADEDGRPVATGEVGEVLVRGPGVMLGYWQQEEATRTAVRDGWMHTGDGGRLDELGVLYVVDRIKDMIVSGGENVYSAEVESAIVLHPDVAQCAVIGVPDERWGERVHAVVVPRPGTSPDAEAIAEHCRGLIARFKCPRSVEFRANLPMSPAGKVLKVELRKPYWEGQSRNVA